MKNKIKHFVALAIFFFSTTHFAFSQKMQLLKANDLYSHYAYSEAISEYESLLKKSPEIAEAKTKLADCYRMISKSEKAEYWYGEVVKMPDAKPIYKYYYGEALMNNGKYNMAKTWFTEYHKAVPDDKRGEMALKSIDNIPQYFKDSTAYKVNKLAINSPQADFSPVLYNSGLVFASSRENGEGVKRVHSWTGEPYLNLYYATGKASGFYKAEPFAPDVQVKYNDGPVCFNKTGDEMYLTRNNIERGHAYKSEDEVVKLKIIHAKKQNKEWVETPDFVYNNVNYNCAHPYLSPDGKQLFFASDMPGGYGGMDLYVCKKDSNTWSKPKNLGPKINTAGNELFPYLHDDGTFLFSSNGRDGLGGLDIYWIKNMDNDSSEAKNMGSPVNSSYDDFGVAFDNKTSYGYYSSNRASKSTDDDIYSFKRSLKLEGIVVVKGSDVPIAEAEVILHDKEGGKSLTVSDADGKFEFDIDCNKEYTVNASKDGWSQDEVKFNTLNYFPTENPKVKLQLEQIKKARNYKLIVKVIDKDTKKPLENSVIGIDQTDETIGHTDAKGKWMQPLLPNTTLHLIITKSGYQPKVIWMSNVGQTKEKDMEFLVELKKGEDIGPYDRWYKIVYYDFDKANVRDPDATKTMEEVLKFVKEHDDVRLLMNSYCDARGTNAYNQKLSKRRAETATKWLTDRGMDRKMVEKMEWAGESMLINRCADGSICSEEDHQLNRRTEIRVIRVDKGLSMKK
ncbi:MAG: OmpA family protein [Bacteroidia bacterium]